MADWRASLQAMDEKAGRRVEHQIAKRQKEQQERRRLQGSNGMVAGNAQAESGVESSPGGEAVVDTDGMDEHEAVAGDEAEDDDEEESHDHLDEMELDRPKSMQGQAMGMMSSRNAVVSLDSSEDDDDSDDSDTNELAAQLAKNIRPNDARMG